MRPELCGSSAGLKLFFFLSRQDPKHFDADLAFLRGGYVLDLLAPSLESADRRERLKSCLGVSLQKALRVARAENNCIRHDYCPAFRHHVSSLRQEQRSLSNKF